MATDNRQLQSQLAEPERQEELEIDLVELLYRLLEKARYLILAALIGALAAGILSYRFITPTYKATSKLYVLNSKDSVVDLSSLQSSSNIAADYLEVFSNWHVHDKVIQELNLPYTYTQIQRMVNVSNKNATRIIYITITSTKPVEAQRMAETYAEVAREFIAATMGTEMPTVFEHAQLPVTPSAPNKTRNIAIGFILGALLAAVIIVVQFIVDDRVRNADMIERKLNLSVLGMMPVSGQEDWNNGEDRADRNKRKKRSARKGGKK